MTKPALEVTGGRELRRTMRAALGDLNDLKAVHRQAAATVERAAVPATPRRSGALAGTHRAAGTTTMAVVRVGYKRVPYAKFIHSGSRKKHVRGRPWAAEAAHRTEPVWTRYYAAAVDQIVSTIKGA